MTNPRSTVARAGAALAGALLLGLLSACGGAASAGAAAVIGDSQISTDDLNAQVEEVQAARALQPGSPDAALVSDVLQRLVITDLVNQAADDKGITVSQGEIDGALAEAEASLGGRDALVLAFLDSSVPESAIDGQIRLSLTVGALGATLAPDTAPEVQQQAVFDYVIDLGKQLDTEVSPRFGTWNADELQIGPAPTDLSVPRESSDPLADLVPSG